MLKTEKVSQRYKGIDTWPAEEAAMSFWHGQLQAITSVYSALPVVAKASIEIAKRLSENENSRIVYVGAGSSGLLAMQDAMELTPTFGFPLERIVFCMAGGDEARLRPIGVSEDSRVASKYDFDSNNISKNDIIIAVAASGTTPYTLNYLELARETGSLIVSIANNKNVPLLKNVDFPLFLDSGREVVAGSTRMNAGTAQKCALGILSSMIFMNLGHIVDGMMVSVVADNAKLVDRATGIVEKIANVEEAQAMSAMKQAGGSVKVGSLIALGCEKGEAEKLLDRSKGNLREAMSLLPTKG